MYLKKRWYLKTYIDTNGSIDFEKLHQIKTDGCLVLTSHQSSLKTNQISNGPYIFEIREEKGMLLMLNKIHKFSQNPLSNL